MKLYSILFLSLVLLASSAVTVSAFGKPAWAGNPNQGSKVDQNTDDQNGQEDNANDETREGGGIGNKLHGKGNQNSCEAQAANLKKRMGSLVANANNMEGKFDSIATRVEEYYTNKVTPAGKTVSNYDTLVSNIQTAKDQVQTDVTTAQNNVDSFSCTSPTPGMGGKTQFREDMQTVRKDLKAYRTAIKDLIVAIHSINGGAVSPTTTK